MSRENLPQWLRDGDPARDLPPVPPLTEDQLASIIDQGPRTEPIQLRPARSRRRQATWGLAAAAALAVGATVLADPFSAPPAFADWTAVPQDPDSALAAEAVSICPPRLDVADLPDPANTNPANEEVPDYVLVDQRGTHAYVVAASTYGWTECFVEVNPDGVSLTSAANGLYGSTPLADPEPGGVTVLTNGTTSWSQDSDAPAGSFTSAFGRAGADVTAVTLRASSGSVEATVSDGWWAAWIPSTSTFSDEVTVERSDGSSKSESATQ